MVCIYCGDQTRVINSRAQKRSNGTWRRRHCMECDAIFTSIEQADLSKSLVVTMPSGVIIGFQRDRLFIDIYEAVRHRKTAHTDATALTDTIITQLLPQSSAGSLDIAQIVSTAQKVLGAFDHAAATHYTAYHKTLR